MAEIASVECKLYRVPLPVALSDSSHGVMRDFELITVQVRDRDGAEGVGYTYTVGRNGGAVHHVLSREIAGTALEFTLTITLRELDISDDLSDLVHDGLIDSETLSSSDIICPAF